MPGTTVVLAENEFKDRRMKILKIKPGFVDSKARTNIMLFDNFLHIICLLKNQKDLCVSVVTLTSSVAVVSGIKRNI